MSILLTIEEIKKVNPDGCFCGETDNNNLLKAQLKKIYDWGNEPCPHSQVKTRKPHKRQCSVCWAELKKEIKQIVSD